MPYRIVVDADIARSASDRSADEVALICCRTLECFDRGGHHLAMSAPLLQEWLKPREDRPAGAYYASRFSYTWLANMRSRRRIFQVDPSKTPSMLDQVIQALGAQQNPTFRGEIEKDIHLADAALAADGRVISCDRAFRRRLARAGGQVEQLRPLLWLHPQDHNAPDWLLADAPDLPEYRLGAGAEPPQSASSPPTL